MKNSQRGFIVPLVLTIIVLLFIGGAYVYMQQKQANSPTLESAATQKNQLERVNPVQSSATTSVFIVTEKGGILFSPDEKMQVEVPEGAIQTVTKINIVVNNSDFVGQVGSLYEISLPDTKQIMFLKPVTLKINYDPQMLNGPAERLWLGFYGGIDEWYPNASTSIDISKHTASIIINSIGNLFTAGHAYLGIVSPLGP